MVGTALRLVVASVCLLFCLMPIINIIAIPLLGPVFVWASVSAVRRIWRGHSPVTQPEASDVDPGHALGLR